MVLDGDVKPAPHHHLSLSSRSTPGFTPLILAATAGHVGVVEILLDKGGDIEAQSERTKDTPLSLACSGGRQEVSSAVCACQSMCGWESVQECVCMSASSA